MGNLTYEQKKEIADKYIGDLTNGYGWDDLADVNSLHDAQTENDIKELCNERMNDENPFEALTDM